MNNDGYALFLSFIIIVALVILTVSMSLLLSGEMGFTAQNLNQTRAFYLAESGLEFATAAFYDEYVWNADSLIKSEYITDLESNFYAGSNTNLNYIEKEQIDSYTLKLTSKATVNGVSRTIVNVFGEFSLNAFDYSFAAGSKIHFGNNPDIIGNVFATDGFEYQAIQNFLKKIGDDVELIDGKGKVFLKYLDDTQIEKIKEIAMADTGDTDYVFETTADIDLSKIGNNNIVYSRVDIFGANNLVLNGEGILLVEGKIVVDNNLEVNVASESGNDIVFTDDDLTIIVIPAGDGGHDDGKIIIKNNLYYKGLLYAENGIEIKNNAEVTGSIITKNGSILPYLNSNNNFTAIYDNSYFDFFLDKLSIDLAENDSESSNNLTLISWEEPNN